MADLTKKLYFDTMINIGRLLTEAGLYLANEGRKTMDKYMKARDVYNMTEAIKKHEYVRTGDDYLLYGNQMPNYNDFKRQVFARRTDKNNS